MSLLETCVRSNYHNTCREVAWMHACNNPKQSTEVSLSAEAGEVGSLARVLDELRPGSLILYLVDDGGGGSGLLEPFAQLPTLAKDEATTLPHAPGDCRKEDNWIPNPYARLNQGENQVTPAPRGTQASTPEVTGSDQPHTPNPKRRISKAESEVRVSNYLKKHWDRAKFGEVSGREIRQKTGVSLGMVPKLKCWKALQEELEHRGLSKRPHRRKAVAFTSALDNQVGNKDEKLARLLGEQLGSDYELSPLDPGRQKVRARKQF